MGLLVNILKRGLSISATIRWKPKQRPVGGGKQ
jgi:hypothetical protein